ncbi:TonB C-terminal domain-containing protein [Cupriavidus basilensis]|uniref:TonB C-terminal domain-containing protein n=1 Tax=Cupriavidus basilensis TaxID=68895 RepID=A0A643FYZ4_9BURK|nr:TonB C-terminal domain-containing protein [Cupriavidus basilensis]QOT82002.1 TonB C-terminal domain-containing protein [Cupriavidus basilensis]
MTGNPASVSVLALAGCLIGLGSLTAMESARAQSTMSSGTRPTVPVAGESTKLFDFDIPAQPLDAALNRYADVTGHPALFPSDIVEGRVSSAVRGRYSAEASMRLLLDGTGLVADKRNSGLGQTFVLKKADEKAGGQRGGMAALFSAQGYAGLAQARIWQALCSDTRTAPGSYSALLRFHLDADGSIQGERLLGSSGDARRDSALLDALRRVHIERSAPPAIAHQPLIMVIRPTDPAAGPQCGQDNSEF